MKVVMLKDVGGVGQAGTICDVSDGYALHFLIPRSLAVQATKAKIVEVEAKQKSAAALEAEHQKEWAENAQKIEGRTVVVSVKTNESGHLYQQLQPDMIVSAIEKELGIVIPPEAITLNAPIKKIGESTVEIRFGGESAKFTVQVIPFRAI